MNLFFTAVTLISAVLLIIVILLQQSKGSELGAAFGSGARGGLFTAQGKANFLTRTTRWLMTIFLFSSLMLSIFLVDNRQDGVLENLQEGSGNVEQIDDADSTEVILGSDVGSGDDVVESSAASESESATANTESEREANRETETPD